MDAQDVADEQLLAAFARRRDDLFGRFERVGERLLAEDMRARGERLERHRRVMLGIGGDRDGVGLERGERFGQAFEPRNAGNSWSRSPRRGVERA